MFSAEDITDSFNKIKVGQMADAFEALQGIINCPIDGAYAIKVIRIIRWARPHYIKYINARTTVAELYGIKLDDGLISIPAETKTEFENALKPYREELLEFDSGMTLDPSILSGLKITAVAVELLEPFMIKNF